MLHSVDEEAGSAGTRGGNSVAYADLVEVTNRMCRGLRELGARCMSGTLVVGTARRRRTLVDVRPGPEILSRRDEAVLQPSITAAAPS